MTSRRNKKREPLSDAQVRILIGALAEEESNLMAAAERLRYAETVYKAQQAYVEALQRLQEAKAALSQAEAGDDDE